MNYNVILRFIIIFIIVYAIYYFVIIKKCKKNKKIVPAEVNLILLNHKIDTKKINLYKMIKVVSVVTCLIISMTISIIMSLFNNTIIVILAGAVGSILIAIIIYNFIGNYYEKKSIKVVHKK